MKENEKKSDKFKEREKDRQTDRQTDRQRQRQRQRDVTDDSMFFFTQRNREMKFGSKRYSADMYVCMLWWNILN